MTKTRDWWQSRSGLLVSDEVQAPTGDVAALFIRCDRGDEPADHHTLNFASIPGVPPKFHHAAFEVADLDDLMAGSHYLEERGYQHDWGVGRHILGSQVFDYWRDPWGHRVEHWTDGDLFDVSTPKNVTDLPTMMGHQWGPASPADSRPDHPAISLCSGYPSVVSLSSSAGAATRRTGVSNAE